MEKMKNVGQRKAVLLAERDIQAVVRRGCLQLEIERAAEAFAQSQAPSFVDARAKRGVDDQLYAAAFVEEALGDYGGLGGNGAEHRATGEHVSEDLLGSGLIQAAFGFQP